MQESRGLIKFQGTLRWFKKKVSLPCDICSLKEHSIPSNIPHVDDDSSVAHPPKTIQEENSLVRNQSVEVALIEYDVWMSVNVSGVFPKLVINEKEKEPLIWLNLLEPPQPEPILRTVRVGNPSRDG